VETPPEPERKWMDGHVTRKEFSVVIAILLAGLIFLGAWLNQVQAEQRTYARGQKEILTGVQQIHDDIKLFTNELIAAKKAIP
jgi:hypothetical protein